MDPEEEISAVVLLKKGKRGAASFLHHLCLHSNNANYLYELLDLILNPNKPMDDWDSIDWCKWLMAGGSTPDEFGSLVRRYDNASTCGLVWTANFVAYRCRTCGISPCMSLCAECFQLSNHNGHDFNMFRSQAGGACDCGDTSVMKESGFCTRHGPKAQQNKPIAPPKLICVAEAVMPRIIFRLILHLREQIGKETIDNTLPDAELFLTMLRDLNGLGAAMRRVMTNTLTNHQIYKAVNEYKSQDPEYNKFVVESRELYEQALLTFENPDPPEEYKDVTALQKVLHHRSFLEELVFWTVKYEFPQRIVCLLLNMLPDPEYKEALTKAFVLHYARIATMLEKCADPDTLSNRVVHVSVQLFSNETLAFDMVETFRLLHVMVISLKEMMSKILIENTLHDKERNYHLVVECAKPVMKEHCYWPLVSDLNNVLSHRPVALKFMMDDVLPEMWFSFISMFQGMNVNHRELGQHVEYEPNTYYAAFSAELEASAYPMWALVSHLNNASTANLTKRVISSCLISLQDWFNAINYIHPNDPDNLYVSFHLPLHRYFAVLTCQAVRHQGLTLGELLPSTELLHLLAIHPLRVQSAFYEILSGLWVRNGLQIKGQAMTYIQCNFCNSMVDADLFLLQLCCTHLSPEQFLTSVLNKFHVMDWMSLAPFASNQRSYIDGENESPMVEAFLTFLASLVGVRTNIGISESDLSKLEMVTLLCMGDKTHSQLIELMPERCGTSQTRDFETMLEEVAEFRGPNLEGSGTMQQGMYNPKPYIWKDHFDPVHVLLRAVHRRDFQNAMDRFSDYGHSVGKLRSGTSAWPPFRIPGPVHSGFQDPSKVLASRLFHASAFVVLHKSVFSPTVSDHVIALVIHLLELAVITANPDPNTQVTTARQFELPYYFKDKDLTSWYQSDLLSNNLRTTITRIIFEPEPTVFFESSDNEGEWDRDMEVLDTSQQLDNQALELEILETTPLSPQIDLVSLAPPGIEWNPEGTSTAALPAPVVLPAVMAGTEIVPHAGPSTSEVSASSTTSRTQGGGALVPASSTTTPGTSGAVVKKSRRIRRRVRNGNAQNNCVSSGSNASILLDSNKKGSKPGVPHCDAHLDVNESLISLLLRLHSQLTGMADSFDPEDKSMNFNECVGDGAFFVGRLLHRIYQLDTPCREAIIETKNRIWPRVRRPDATDEDSREYRDREEREERKRKAKERQKKLIEEFANQQKQFMQRNMKDDDEMEWNILGGRNSTESLNSSPTLMPPQEYHCVICNQKTQSREDNPIGLVVLVQATSVLGFQRKSSLPPKIATTEEERIIEQKRDDTLGSDFERRFEELRRYFNQESAMMSVSFAWQSGVHVQTCGHHIHLDCLKSYQISIRTTQRQQSLALEGGEYWCPLCRQLANSVLPMSPRLGECAAAMVRSRVGMNPKDNNNGQNVQEAEIIAREIADLLKENPPPPSMSTALDDAMSKAMGDMRAVIPMKFSQRAQYHSWQSVFLFVSSIARTNLEVELLRAAAVNAASHTAPPRRPCIVPLLHVLAMHARALARWPAWDTWARLSGLSYSSADIHSSPVPIQNAAITAGPEFHDIYPQALIPASLGNPEHANFIPGLPEVPLLLRDPTALLTHFILLLPLHLDQIYFTSVVRTLYHLIYIQASIQLTYNMTAAERSEWSTITPSDKLQSIEDVLGLIVKSLEAGQFYSDEHEASSSNRGIALQNVFENEKETDKDEKMCTNMDSSQLQTEVYKLCLQFLRVAALLRHFLYERPLQDNDCDMDALIPPAPGNLNEEPLKEALRLIKYLDLGKSPINLPSSIALGWFLELGSLSAATISATRPLLAEAHINWHPPQLLHLPQLYDTIFQFYHRRICTKCHFLPREGSICLLCGQIVCLKENCCKQHNICEAVQLDVHLQHSIDCGGGTGVFLVVTSSYVIVIRGKRACLWGSVYLDTFGEEDRELKRGKPLLLSKERYQLLQEQWLSHRFDHTSKKWVWHRDAL